MRWPRLQCALYPDSRVLCRQALAIRALVFSSMKADVPSALGSVRVIRSGLGLDSHWYHLDPCSAIAPRGQAALSGNQCPHFLLRHLFPESPHCSRWAGARPWQGSAARLPVVASGLVQGGQAAEKLSTCSLSLRVPGRPWCEQQSLQTRSRPLA